ncbi:hypothetical protein Hanom_Chr12g01122041 [Helianthus anomalus]
MLFGLFFQVTMSSSESSGVYDDDVVPLEISSDNEPIVEIISSDDSNDESNPEEDPDYMYDEIPNEVLVFHIDHLDEDIGDGKVIDIGILEMSSPVVSIVDVSSSDVSDRVSFAALRCAGRRANAIDSNFDTIPIATPTPSPIMTYTSIRTLTPTPTITPPVTPTSRHTPGTLTCGLTLPDDDTRPIGHGYLGPIPYHVDTSPIFMHDIPTPRLREGTSQQPFHSPSYVPAEHLATRYSSYHMPTSYHITCVTAHHTPGTNLLCPNSYR